MRTKIVRFRGHPVDDRDQYVMSHHTAVIFALHFYFHVNLI